MLFQALLKFKYEYEIIISTIRRRPTFETKIILLYSVVVTRLIDHSYYAEVERL